jgi:rRNA biogenesis protein RRP5
MSVTTKRKTPRTATDDRPAKKSKFDPAEAGPSQSFSSILSSSKAEADFPRGGGTTLTQVEVKEARAEGLAEARKSKQKSKSRKGKDVQSKDKAAKDTVSIAHLSYKVRPS